MFFSFFQYIIFSIYIKAIRYIHLYSIGLFGRFRSLDRRLFLMSKQFRNIFVNNQYRFVENGNWVAFIGTPKKT